MKRYASLVVAGLAATVMLASASNVHAITVTNLGNNFDPGPPTTNPAPTSIISGVIQQGITGSVVNVNRDPFEGGLNGCPNVCQYTSVQGGAAGLWTFGGGAFQSELSLIWGSPDNYNFIEFFANADGTGSLGSVSNGDIVPPGPNAVLNALVRITNIGFFRSIVISSGQNAFEFANLTASCENCAPGDTPIPGAVVLFGSVLAGGVGGMQIMRRRRKTA